MLSAQADLEAAARERLAAYYHRGQLDDRLRALAMGPGFGQRTICATLPSMMELFE